MSTIALIAPAIIEAVAKLVEDHTELLYGLAAGGAAKDAADTFHRFRRSERVIEQIDAERFVDVHLRCIVEELIEVERDGN